MAAALPAAIGLVIAAFQAEAGAEASAVVPEDGVEVALAPVVIAEHPVWVVRVAVLEAEAAVEVAVGGVAVVVVAAAEGGNYMKTLLATCLILSLTLVTSGVRAQTTTAAKAKTFATANAAAEALIDAADKFDEAALVEVLGPNSYDIIHTSEPARDREIAKEFAARARARNSVSVERSGRRAFLLVGDESWPFPVPIVKQKGGWVFDARAGRQEILHRRIGRNELDAIEICRGFVEAQHEYALMKRDGSGVNQYAQRIISTPGKQDGLAWQTAEGGWDGPVGEKVARAIDRGYTTRAEPYHGYFFKVLKGQGPAAPLGQLNFVVKGVMIGGFALIAFPAQYRVTGVQTFMVSHDGVVYQRDLGPQTSELASQIELFNPDKTWTPVVDQ